MEGARNGRTYRLDRTQRTPDQSVYNYLSGRQAWPAIRARFVSLAMGVPLRALLDPKGEGADAAARWVREIEATENQIAAEEV
jgi:hypothetical protein